MPIGIASPYRATTGIPASGLWRRRRSTTSSTDETERLGLRVTGGRLGFQEHGVALHLDVVHLQRSLGQAAWLAARAQTPLPQVLQTGQQVAIECSIAQRD